MQMRRTVTFGQHKIVENVDNFALIKVAYS